MGCWRAAGGASGLQEAQAGRMQCWRCWGGGAAVLSCCFVWFLTEASLAHAPDRSVAATLHRRGSGARGFTSRSCACSSSPRRVAVLVRPGPRLKAFPRVGLARFPGYGRLATHVRRRRVPVDGRYLCRSVGGSH